MLKPDESAVAEFSDDPTLEELRALRQLNLFNPAGTYRQLAMGQLANSGLSPATLWVMKRQALREIEDLMGSIPADNVLKNFVESQQGNTVGAFHRLEQDLRTLQQGDVPQAARREQLAGMIKLHQDSLNLEAKNWQLLSFNAQALLSKSRNETGADRGYHLQLAEYNALMDAKVAAAKIQANELKIKNAVIPATTLYEKHEQTVNAIYIETALLGNKITPAQAQTLKDIAMLCPDIVGEASQKARIVYGFYYAQPLPQWGPCGAQVQEDIEDRGYVPSLQTAVKVYPVPTTTDLMVSGAYSTTQQRHYQVVNLLGEVILAGQVTDPVQQISVGSFPSGMYYLRILEEQQMVAVKNFIVKN